MPITHQEKNKETKMHTQFLNNIIIIKTKVLLPQAKMTLTDFGYPV
jgi:hypothetical protein